MRCIGIMRNVFNPINPINPVNHSSDDVKAHNGEIKVKTTENEGSKFIISVPPI